MSTEAVLGRKWRTLSDAARAAQKLADEARASAEAAWREYIEAGKTNEVNPASDSSQ